MLDSCSKFRNKIKFHLFCYIAKKAERIVVLQDGHGSVAVTYFTYLLVMQCTVYTSPRSQPLSCLWPISGRLKVLNVFFCHNFLHPRYLWRVSLAAEHGLKLGGWQWQLTALAPGNNVHLCNKLAMSSICELSAAGSHWTSYIIYTRSTVLCIMCICNHNKSNRIDFATVVKVDRRIGWHYTTTILCLRIGARLTRYQNCKFHNFASTISRHADGISRYSVSPSAGPLLPLLCKHHSLLTLHQASTVCTHTVNTNNV